MEKIYILFSIMLLGWAQAQPASESGRQIPHAENRAFLLDSASSELLGYQPNHFSGSGLFEKAGGTYVADSFQTSAFQNKILDYYHHDVTSLSDTFEFSLIDPHTGASKFVFPIKGRVSSGFGPRYFWGYHFHYGTDITLQRGDSVVAAMDGTVRIVRVDRWGYGNFVVITHDNGLETLYGHLDKSLVLEGQPIKAGELVGLGGSTGRSSGPHLHFEFRFMGEQFDPEKVCSFEDGQLKCSKIQLDRNWFRHLGGKNYASAAKVANPAAIGTGGAVYHTIRPGQNLGLIARQYNTSVESLCRLNGITARTTILAGKTLRVK
ncbi:MAG: peptidoglycan DD-metalloendopeptidase family protein [Bacteroidetes bacterium]|jgi:hypothetical protein|nr:peptidoglycan DD-metalloendopeptidase family protein [Bacteroidota bacterium]